MWITGTNFSAEIKKYVTSENHNYDYIPLSADSFSSLSNDSTSTSQLFLQKTQLVFLRCTIMFAKSVSGRYQRNS